MDFTNADPEAFLDRITEIRRYYDACEILSGGNSSISKAMLAFSLGMDQSAEFEKLLEELTRKGIIAAVIDSQIVFASAEAV